MGKKAWLLLAALALGLCAHVRVLYRVEIAGECLSGRYAAAALREGLETARATAEELLPGEATLPTFRTRAVLSLTKADGDPRRMSAALLDATAGIETADAVWVNGELLGTVPDGQRLLDKLHALLRSDMPEAAVVGNLGGHLRIKPVYTRAGTAREDGELLRDILGAAPVVYLDAEGKVV